MTISLNRTSVWPARILKYSARIGGGVSMLAFGMFMFAGPLGREVPSASHVQWWVWDSLLSLLFFIQHSAMVRRPIRARMARWIPDYSLGAVFTLASATTLGLLALCWQPSGIMLMEINGPLKWLANIGFGAAVAGMAWGVRALYPFDPYGIGPIDAQLSGKPQRQHAAFTVRGPYLWVRHPLYFFLLVMLWCRPDLTADRLLFNLLWSAWIYVGTVLEERDLVADFGDLYRQYQKQVPILIPWRGYNGDARNINRQ